MKPSRLLTTLVLLIAFGALIATTTGLFWPLAGESYAFTSLRGEVVRIQGHGLYRYEPVSIAAQAIPQDIVTLFVAIPLLLAFLRLGYRTGLRGQLLLAGLLGYFLYTYMSMAFGSAYNELFLLYVALFSLSLFALGLAVAAIDVASLPTHFNDSLPRRWIAGYLFAGSLFLLLAWLGRIVPPLLNGQPPLGLETNTTLFIQVMDLGLLAPIMTVGGVQLLRRQPLGYLVAAVGLIKFAIFGLALIAMVIGQALAGVVISPAEAIIFPLLAIAAIWLAGRLVWAVRPSPLHAERSEASQWGGQREDPSLRSG